MHPEKEHGAPSERSIVVLLLPKNVVFIVPHAPMRAAPAIIQNQKIGMGCPSTGPASWLVSLQESIPVLQPLQK